ncbi:MAG: hypothetical protein CMM50_01200 [Rhodospirillaceae bacterium]|nr:hypothetical protein [Rhodospirillaceae bacterium]
MCDPISIGSALLTVAGSAAQAAGARKAEKARDQAIAAERMRQDEFGRQSEIQFGDALEEHTRDRQDEKMGDAMQRRQQAFERVNARRPSAERTPGSSRAPAVIQSEAKSQNARADRRSGAEASAQASLGSWADLLLSGAQARQRAGDQVNAINSFRRGSLDVLPLEVQAAGRRGRGLWNLGELLVSGGELGSRLGAKYKDGTPGSPPPDAAGAPPMSILPPQFQIPSKPYMKPPAIGAIY